MNGQTGKFVGDLPQIKDCSGNGFWDICNFRSCSVTADGIIDNNKVIDMKILKKYFCQVLHVCL